MQRMSQMQNCLAKGRRLWLCGKGLRSSVFVGAEDREVVVVERGLSFSSYGLSSPHLN